jgi:hypothetical protein
VRWIDRVIDRYSVAVGYAAGLVLGAVLLRARPVPEQRRWLDWASTDLANARTHPLGSLVVSAFLTEGEVRWWVPLALVALGVVGARFGAWRTALLVAAAHVLGTVVSEGILAYRIAAGAVPASYRYLVDVGPSYVVVAALAAGMGYARWPGRLLCAAGFAVVAPSLFGGLFQLEVSAVGHVCAIVVALALGGRYAYRSRYHRTAEPSPTSDG